MTAALTGSVCLVTGGGRGIGRASAVALARAGGAVAVAARSAEQLAEVVAEIRGAGGTAIAVPADVTSAASVTAMVERTVAELGRLDVLLCNAGGGQTGDTLADSDPDGWAATIAVNLTSVFHCCHAAVPVMAGQGGGKILVMGSGAGHAVTRGMSAYGAAKAGVAHLVGVLAQEVWRAGIDVNEIVPGPVATELTSPHFTVGASLPGARSEVVKAPEDVAELVVWLATRPTGGPTGQTFSLARRPL